MSIRIGTSKRHPLLLTGVFLILASSGCEIDYHAGQVDDTLKEEIPDLVMFNLKQTDIRDTGQKIVLSAERAEDYRKLKETRFYMVNFRENDPAGGLLREGHTDFGQLKDNNDASLTGNIRIDSRENEARVEADELNWLHEKKLLDGSEKGRVSIVRDDGSLLEGTDFHADFRNDIVEFRGPVTGTLVTNEPAVESPR